MKEMEGYRRWGSGGGRVVGGNSCQSISVPGPQTGNVVLTKQFAAVVASLDRVLEGGFNKRACGTE